MAIGQFTRNDTDKSKLNIGAMLRCGWDEVTTMPMTVAAATAALPAIGAVVQEGTSADELGAAYVCSGTFILTQDTIGILAVDSSPAETGVSFITGAKRILVPLTAAQAPAIGADIYVTTATMTCTVTDAGGEVYLGKCLQTVETNPSNLRRYLL